MASSLDGHSAAIPLPSAAPTGQVCGDKSIAYLKLPERLSICENVDEWGQWTDSVSVNIARGQIIYNYQAKRMSGTT